jgi:hypothetical protein
MFEADAGGAGGNPASTNISFPGGGGILGGIGSIMGTIAANRRAKEAHQLNLDNFAHQQAVFDYQKALQKQIFSREDTSVSRRVSDLKKSGLSPVLAAGQGARAGQAIPVKAPQTDTSGKLAQMAALQDFAGRMLDTTKSISEIALINSQTERNTVMTPIMAEKAKADLTHQLNTNVKLQNTIKHEIDLAKEQADTAKWKRLSADFEAQMDRYDWQLYKQYYEGLQNYQVNQSKSVLPDGRVMGYTNPIFLDYLAKKLVVEGASYNLKWHTDNKMPLSGNATTANVAANIGTSIGNFIKDEWNKIRNKGK